MAPRVTPVEPSEAMPSRTQVVVIGGGIIGASAALELATRGIPVVLCEKGHIAGEQSSRNWGWVRTMGRDPAEIPLSIESLRIWRGLDKTVESETGFRQAGTLYICDNEKELAQYEAWLEHARHYQVDSRLIDARRLRSIVGETARGFVGGLHTPTDGRAEPQQATPAIATAARRRGATVLTGCAVRGIETEAGRVAAAVTEKGRIVCERVVLAGGAWSRLFCGNAGIDLPQLKVLGSVMRTKPLKGPEVTAGGSDFAFRKRLDGGYTVAQRNANVAEIVPDSFRLFFDFLPALIKQRNELRLRVGGRFFKEWRSRRKWPLDAVSPFEEVRVLDPEPSDRILAQARDNLERAFPAFRGMEIAEKWAGMIDVTPDAVPIISPVASLPGLFIATGFSGHGFGIGPGAGRLVADLVADMPPIVDPAPFRLERFRGRVVTSGPARS